MGALSGFGTGIGVVFLFRGMSAGRLSVVVPLSDVGGVALPVLVGVLMLGERPSAPSWLGILASGPALGLITHVRGQEQGETGSADGLISGLGFAYCEFTRHHGRPAVAHASSRSEPLRLRPSLTADNH